MEEIDAATRRLKQALVERMLGGELTRHLGYAPGSEKPDAAPNHRNGTSPKRVTTDDGPVAIAMPRDRAGTFAPVLISRPPTPRRSKPPHTQKSGQVQKKRRAPARDADALPTCNFFRRSTLYFRLSTFDLSSLYF